MTTTFLSRLIGRIGRKTSTALRTTPPTAPLVAVRPAVVAPGQAGKDSLPIYPPLDAGVRAASVEQVLASQQKLVHKLRRFIALEPDEFEIFYLRPLRALAAHINLLPASKHQTHAGAGGLFRLCLEVGVYSAQASEGAIFTAREPIERRRELERKWQYATFLAGLCCEIYRAIGELTVVTAQGQQWAPYSETLLDWLQACGTDVFYVRWIELDKRDPSTRGTAALLAGQIIPQEALTYLQSGSPKIVQAMMSVITDVGTRLDENPIERLILDVRRKVFERDDALRPSLYGRLTVGAHLEPYIINAIRKLVREGRWRVNTAGARIWYGSDGLFMVWRAALRDVRHQLTQDGVTGIPDQDDTILDILRNAGALSQSADGSYFYSVQAPDQPDPLFCVRFSRADSILGEDPADALPHKLAQDAGHSAAPARPRPPTSANAQAPAPQARGGAALAATVQPGLFDSGELADEAAPGPTRPEADQPESETHRKPMPKDAAQPAEAHPAMGSAAHGQAMSGSGPAITTRQEGTGGTSVGAVGAAQGKEPAAAGSPDSETAPPVTQAHKREGHPSSGARSDLGGSDGRIPEVREQRVDTDRIPKEFAARVSKPTLMVLASILQSWRNPPKAGRPGRFTPQGLAFPLDYLTSRGASPASLVEEIYSNGWSVAEEKPNGKVKKLLSIDFGDGPTSCLVLRTHVAQDLGFSPPHDDVLADPAPEEG